MNDLIFEPVEINSTNYTRDYQLSPNYNLGELVITEHRDFIDINLEQAQVFINNLKRCCIELLEPIGILLNELPNVSSGFRCNDLNKAVGGSLTSQHSFGEATDTTYKKHTIQQVFNEIAFNSSIQYSQIIIEFGWIHIAVIDEQLYPGKKFQKLIASKKDGKIIYTPVTKPI